MRVEMRFRFGDRKDAKGINHITRPSRARSTGPGGLREWQVLFNKVPSGNSVGEILGRNTYTWPSGSREFIGEED